MNPKALIIIDCGHGGIDGKGRYTTAPSKMYRHLNGDIAYEGLYNRLIGDKVYCKLTALGIKSVFTVQPDDPTDLSLDDRVKIEKEFNKQGFITHFVSLHSNAGGGTGFEIFTGIGQTKSDILADYIGDAIHNEFPTIAFRRDMLDGDLDKEANFYVLKNTIGAAVLIENLFFDNRVDFEILRSETFQERVSTAIVAGIICYLQQL